MITNFILNRSNVLSTFTTKRNTVSSNSQAIKYIKQQDSIINTFNTIIKDNVLRYFVGVKPEKNKSVKLNLPIKNALWYLWNSAYKLGIDNANSELNSTSSSKFNRVNSLIEFANKKSYEEQQRERLLESEQELESLNENDSDEYDLFTPKKKKNNPVVDSMERTNTKDITKTIKISKQESTENVKEFKLKKKQAAINVEKYTQRANKISYYMNEGYKTKEYAKDYNLPYDNSEERQQELVDAINKEFRRSGQKLRDAKKEQIEINNVVKTETKIKQQIVKSNTTLNNEQDIDKRINSAVVNNRTTSEKISNSTPQLINNNNELVQIQKRIR